MRGVWLARLIIRVFSRSTISRAIAFCRPGSVMPREAIGRPSQLPFIRHRVVVAVADDAAGREGAPGRADDRLDAADRAVEHRAERRQQVLRRLQPRIERPQVLGEVAAGDEVVAAAREQQHPPAGAVERVEVLAPAQHVLERVAGLGAAVDGIGLEGPVDHVLEAERILEPAVALGGDQRPAVLAARHDLLVARLAAQPGDEVGAVEELRRAGAALGRCRAGSRRSRGSA